MTEEPQFKASEKKRLPTMGNITTSKGKCQMKEAGIVERQEELERKPTETVISETLEPTPRKRRANSEKISAQAQLIADTVWLFIARERKRLEELKKKPTETAVTNIYVPVKGTSTSSTVQPYTGPMSGWMRWAFITSRKEMHEDKERTARLLSTQTTQMRRPTPWTKIPENPPARRSHTDAFRDIVIENYMKTLRIKGSRHGDDSELNDYLESKAHLGNNIWYQHMKEVGRQNSKGECFVCALLPYSMGKSKTFVAVEIDVQTAHCLSHVVLCKTIGKFMGSDASLKWATEATDPNEDDYVQDIKTRNNGKIKHIVIRYEKRGVKGAEIRREANQKLNVQGKTPEETQSWKNRPNADLGNSSFTRWMGKRSSNLQSMDGHRSIRTYHQHSARWMQAIMAKSYKTADMGQRQRRTLADSETGKPKILLPE
ncbi:uncharacterized protein [Ambystoma mexicanum]|uniref:uncharacterized protein n=1 Tax=Ambystoma mexicanum TaxID=8296 RepID=UPI0037E9024A